VARLGRWRVRRTFIRSPLPPTVAGVFLSTLLLSFAATLFVAGLFGAYYGKGRSRSMGIALGLLALLVAAIFAALTWPLVEGIRPVFSPDAVIQSVVAVGAAMLGSAVAIVVFVFAVMRT
jgi:hypothetical protein